MLLRKPTPPKLKAPRTSGIYAIAHRPSGRVYVGQSKNIRSRLFRHWEELEDGTHHNYKLLQDYQGPQRQGRSPLEVFEFRVLEQCRELALDAREEYWMVRCNAWYNIRWPDGGKIQRTADGDIIPRARVRQEGNLPWWAWLALSAGMAIGIVLIFS